jgi:hypothetical protein
MIAGVAGFSLGFFGPMLLDPSSGNGPLLGIFITGPLGAVLGGVVGMLHELSLRRSSSRP